ncbi:MAG: Uma2 family endonuclease [Planctomycetota bacterium]|nr:Uma2 family endonuclease [Planctomycetota bacterium]MDA1252118.1 Uma2 family endonuclease [Planctomycetota bacterium]
MSTAHSKQKMTAAEYLDWERQQVERHEFYDDEVFSQARGTRRHSLIGTNTGCVIGNLLAGDDCQVHGSDMRIEIEATGSYVYPDVSVVCPPIEGKGDDVISNPVLVVEVLSPSTEDFDRGTKFGYYRQIPSLRDYLVISQDQARIEHHFLNEGELWSLRDVEGVDEVLQLASLRHDLPLTEVYSKVEFD